MVPVENKKELRKNRIRDVSRRPRSFPRKRSVWWKEKLEGKGGKAWEEKVQRWWRKGGNARFQPETRSIGADEDSRAPLHLHRSN